MSVLGIIVFGLMTLSDVGKRRYVWATIDFVITVFYMAVTIYEQTTTR